MSQTLEENRNIVTIEENRNIAAIEGVGELWAGQTEDPMAGMVFTAPYWLIIKAGLAVIILTTIYLLYSLVELKFSLFGNVAGLAIFAGGPFFVGWTLGLSFMSAKRALIYALVIGLVSTFLMLFLFFTPYRMDVWLDYGPGYSTEMWWYWILSFINVISFVPIGAAVAASTNAYD